MTGLCYHSRIVQILAGDEGGIVRQNAKNIIADKYYRTGKAAWSSGAAICDCRPGVHKGTGQNDRVFFAEKRRYFVMPEAVYGFQHIRGRFKSFPFFRQERAFPALRDIAGGMREKKPYRGEYIKKESRFNPEAAFPNLKYIKNKKEDNVYSCE